MIAASGLQDDETTDGETFIEKYTKGISAVETILALDRLRQSVVVRELVQAKRNKSILSFFKFDGEKWDISSQHMRKTMSVPNFGNVSLFKLRSSLISFCAGNNSSNKKLESYHYSFFFRLITLSAKEQI